ncbi:MAG: hypothetical protein AAFR17_14385 [Pseudomonadota bacterium]
MLYCGLWSAFAAFATLFLGINLGLRLLPSGRAFLSTARQQGRLLAPVGASSPVAVKTVFLFSWVLASVAGWATWTLLRAGLS